MKIENNILEVLSHASVSGNQVFLNGKLDAKTYKAVNKCLEAGGGKWNKKLKAHVFEGDAEERIEQMLATGEVEIPKDDFDFFPTPALIVERLLELAEIKPGMTCLEPSAGQGNIAIPCLNAGAKVTCYEIAKTNADILKAKGASLEVIQGDFLQVEPSPVYDRIVMNPPFCRQADIKHINHAIKFLKDGGILVAVMNSSVLWRDNRLSNDFKEYVYNHDGDIEKLPSESFKETGTKVGTVIAYFTK